MIRTDITVRIASTEYTPYYDILERLDRSYTLVPSTVENGFAPTVEAYTRDSDEGRSLVLLSNPCNPTGVTRHGEDLRHVAAWKKWLLWSGTCWKSDETVYVFDLARAICREKASESNKPLKSLATARTVAAVERLAKSDRKHAATAEQWDVDPDAFNTEES